MGISLEDLRVLQSAEAIADEIWDQVTKWDAFARETVGAQLARAVDSIGANIAEAFGRFHYGEKLNHLYYARGSLFESKYWLNRASVRDLLSVYQAQDFAARLTNLARQLNAFANSVKIQRRDDSVQTKAGTLRESAAEYSVAPINEQPEPLFSEEELSWFQSQISNP